MESCTGKRGPLKLPGSQMWGPLVSGEESGLLTNQGGKPPNYQGPANLHDPAHTRNLAARSSHSLPSRRPGTLTIPHTGQAQSCLRALALAIPSACSVPSLAPSTRPPRPPHPAVEGGSSPHHPLPSGLFFHNPSNFWKWHRSLFSS